MYRIALLVLGKIRWKDGNKAKFEVKGLFKYHVNHLYVLDKQT